MDGLTIAILVGLGYLVYQHGGLDGILSAVKTDGTTPATGTQTVPAGTTPATTTQTPATIAVGEPNPSTPVVSIPADPYGGTGTVYTVPEEGPTYIPVDPINTKSIDPLLHPPKEIKEVPAYTDPYYTPAPVAYDPPVKEIPTIYGDPVKPPEPVYYQPPPVEVKEIPYIEPMPVKESPPFMPPIYEPVYAEPVKQPVIEEPILVTPIDGRGSGRQTKG